MEPRSRTQNDDGARRSNDATIDALFRQYRDTGDRRLRNRLVEEHRWVATTAARRFANRGEPFDDLFQVAQLGVLKAVERFDPDYGSAFATFAIPTVVGELRRHFRDATWAMRVSRRTKELHQSLAATTEALSHELGRSPRPDEIARRLDVQVDDVLEAMSAGAAYRPASLVARDGTEEPDSWALAEIPIGDELDTRLAIRQHLVALPPRERRIVYLRFFEDLTQGEIAELVGVSQVHVSRLLRATMDQLRAELAPLHDGSRAEVTVGSSPQFAAAVA